VETPFTIARNTHQDVVLAALVELYAILRGIGFGLSQMFHITEQASFARFIELARLLNHASSEAYAAELKTVTDAAEATTTRQYIDIVGLGIISIVATVKRGGLGKMYRRISGGSA
jgi:hypothetical protein